MPCDYEGAGGMHSVELWVLLSETRLFEDGKVGTVDGRCLRMRTSHAMDGTGRQ